MQLLVKAVSLFQPGRAERWRCVSEYITNHGIAIGGKKRSEKEVIKQVCQFFFLEMFIKIFLLFYNNVLN